MAIHSYNVEVQADFLQRQARTKPLQAIAELIWNSLDADASKVEVFTEDSELGMTGIIIRDNGHGIPHKEAPSLFTRLGGSWKQFGGKTKNGRILHGYEGRGRFKALALGRVVDWHVTYKDNSQGFNSYTITIIQDNIDEVRIIDESPSESGRTGVEVRVSELHKQFASLQPDNATQQLAEIFALYLKDYRDVTLLYQGNKIDPNAFILSTEVRSLNEINDGERTYPVEIEIVEWRAVTKRALYLCNDLGFPLTQVESRFHIGRFQFSAYLKSRFIQKLYDEEQLDVAEMNAALAKSIEEAKDVIKGYFRERAAQDAKSVVDGWKEEKVYPFEGNAPSPVELVERQVFDIVATRVNEYLPEFSASPWKNKAFQLRMLKQAIERSPDELQEILGKVLELPTRKQQELADLLKTTSLSAIISASRLVSDRLKFITGLETILFSPDYKKHLKERSQLHRILADNAWIFGEEFNLSVDDQSLTEVLRRHKKILGEDVIIDEPVKHINQSTGIIDLMLSRTIRQHRADLEHLVVELKAPKVVIGAKEIMQIEGYAFSVADDERFRGINTQWKFWVLSDDFDSHAAHRRNAEGIIHPGNDDNVTIWVKPWAQLIEENKARLQFFQEKLEYQADKGEALKFLQDNYQEYLEGVLTEEEGEGEPEHNTYMAE